MAVALRATPEPCLTAEPRRPTQPPRHTWPTPAVPLGALDWRLYHWLVHLARTGQDVPRDPAMARWLGFAGAPQVDRAYRKLAAAGLAERTRCPRDGRKTRLLQGETVGLAELPESWLTLTEEA